MSILAASEEVISQGPAWSAQAMEYLRDLPQVFSQIPPWHCAILIPLGLISLLYGLKLLKAMVVIYSALIGAIAGWYLGGYFGVTTPLYQFVCLGAGAVVLGVGGWMFVQVIFGFLGGVAGALAGITLLYAVTDNTNAILIAAAVGFVLGVVLAAIVFRALVVATTSVVGAYMVVTGVIVLLYYVPQVKTALVSGFSEHRYLLPILIGIPAVLGVIYQASQIRAGENK